jgi:hypothetical protein
VRGGEDLFAGSGAGAIPAGSGLLRFGKVLLQSSG